jgi:Domain of unknown function (DUF4347)
MGWFEFGAELIAIEDSDYVGWVESFTSFGELNFQSVETFADVVVSDLGDRKLALLHIQVHGNPSGLGFGPDWLTTVNFDSYRAQLRRLSGKFIANGWVALRACNVGENLALLRRFHQLWSVGVVAGRGSQNNVLDANFGSYQIVYPDGREDTSFFRPPWTEYNASRRLGSAMTSRLF